MIALDFGLGISIGGIVGFIIREIIGDRMARNRALETIRITEFNKGAAAFRSAFVGEIVLLRKSIKLESKKIDEIITDAAFIRHEKAKVMFEAFLDDTSVIGFNKAWNKYINYTHCRVLESTYKPITSVEELSQYCLDQIYNLLEFANPKI